MHNNIVKNQPPLRESPSREKDSKEKISDGNKPRVSGGTAPVGLPARKSRSKDHDVRSVIKAPEADPRRSIPVKDKSTEAKSKNQRGMQPAKPTRSKDSVRKPQSVNKRGKSTEGARNNKSLYKAITAAQPPINAAPGFNRRPTSDEAQALSNEPVTAETNTGNDIGEEDKEAKTEFEKISGVIRPARSYIRKRHLKSKIPESAAKAPPGEDVQTAYEDPNKPVEDMEKTALRQIHPKKSDVTTNPLPSAYMPPMAQLKTSGRQPSRPPPPRNGAVSYYAVASLRDGPLSKEKVKDPKHDALSRF